MSAELHPEIVELQARLNALDPSGASQAPQAVAAREHLAQAGFQWGRLHRGIVDAGLALRASLNAAREAIVKLECFGAS